MRSKNWRVVIHMKAGFKITREIDGMSSDDETFANMAKEQARYVVVNGPSVTDSRGVITWYPPSEVEKIKVVPPNVELGSTNVEVG